MYNSVFIIHTYGLGYLLSYSALKNSSNNEAKIFSYSALFNNSGFIYNMRSKSFEIMKLQVSFI